MDKFVEHVGKTVPIMNNDIDTDQLIPKGFLKRIEKTGYGKFLFYEWRYLEDDKLNPEFVLNYPQYSKATVLISGENFGCGSSREHAAWALSDYGFKSVIAGGFSDIFYNNAIKNGLLPIILPLNTRIEMSKFSSDAEITIDLPNQRVITDIGTFEFDIDPSWKSKLIKGADDIDITLEYEGMIKQYELKYGIK